MERRQRRIGLGDDVSNRPFVMTMDIEGAELLADALQNAPESVIAAAWEAGEASARILRPSIERFTNVDTGYMVGNTDVAVFDGFTVQYENVTPYAPRVNADFHFVEKGTEAVASQIDAIYDAAFDALAARFGSGR